MDDNYTDAKGSNVFTNTNVIFDNTTKKYGTHSAKFNGIDSSLVCANSSCVFGTGQFTIEGWVWVDSTQVTNDALSSGIAESTTGWSVEFQNTGNFAFVSNGETICESGIDKFTLDAWNHFAVTRNAASSVKIFLNGVQQSSASNSNDFTDTRLTIGSRYGINRFFKGYIDDIRITNGVARYVANFTPNSTSFPNQ
jgi:hypothetical protein